MKLDKYTDIVIAVVLLVLLYANPPFLHQLSKNPLGKFVFLVGVLSVTLHNTCLGCLAGLLFVLVLHTNREGMDHGKTSMNKKDGQDEDEKDDDTDMEAVDDMTPEEIEKEAEKPLEGANEVNAKEMLKVAEQMAGFADRMKAEERVAKPVNSQQALLDMFKGAQKQ